MLITISNFEDRHNIRMIERSDGLLDGYRFVKSARCGLDSDFFGCEGFERAKNFFRGIELIDRFQRGAIGGERSANDRIIAGASA